MEIKSQMMRKIASTQNVAVAVEEVKRTLLYKTNAR